MLPKIIDDFEGDLWIDFEGDSCKINVSVKIPAFNSEKKEELIGIAKDKKNAAAVGIVGKIRDAVENFFLSEGPAESLDASLGLFGSATGYSEGVGASCIWTLEQYKTALKKAEKGEDWDELEKSVIASVADDVIVGVKGKRADIIIVKKFA